MSQIGLKLNLTHQYKGSTTATWHIAGLCIYLVLGLCFCITYGAKMKTSDPTQSCYIGKIYASSLKLFLVPGWKYALQCYKVGQSMGIYSLLEPASRGQQRNCSFQRFLCKPHFSSLSEQRSWKSFLCLLKCIIFYVNVI